MHRDVNPSNLGVVSFNPPRGILLDLDSATRDEESSDHMQGTVPYLAPEIIMIKLSGELINAATLRPLPYRKSVDMWAMGLSVFAHYIGHQFTWGPYNPGHTSRGMKRLITHVKEDSYTNFSNHLKEKRVSADSSEAHMLLDLTERMTQWDPGDRIEVSMALNGAQQILARTQQGGIIEPKASRKRQLNQA